MIAFLDGTVAGKTLTSAFIATGGIGFEVGMSNTSLSKLPETGERVLVYTYLQVREDGMSLFGFLSMEEKALFEKLITVSGVGPKVALAALSSYNPEQLTTLIAAQDTAAIQRVPGIGKKMASRIILELKGSIEQGMGSMFADETPTQDAARQAVADGLLGMGFTTAEIELALKGAPEQASEQVLLQYALKKLGA